jgi:hypothetical protein
LRKHLASEPKNQRQRSCPKVPKHLLTGRVGADIKIGGVKHETRKNACFKKQMFADAVMHNLSAVDLLEQQSKLKLPDSFISICLR